MKFDETTTMKEITVAGIKLNIPQPYAEGHTINANEAKAINQLLVENVRNNFTNTVKKAIEEAGDETQLDIDSLQEQFLNYVEGYEFNVRRSGGGGGARLDPVEKLARDLARAHVRRAIKNKGLKVSDFTGSKITELAVQFIEKNSWFMEEAERRIQAQQEAIADLDIDLSVDEDEAEVA